MKKLIIIGAIALAIFVAGVFLPPPDGFFRGTSNDTSLANLQTKYDQATEIKAKYQLENGALVRKDIDINSVRATIGNKVEPELFGAEEINFEPTLTLTRWDETSFKMMPDISDVDLKDRTLTFDNDKILFETPKTDYLMYETKGGEGGYVFDVILKEKPVSNVLVFQIETEGLDFFYQPALTQQEIDEGSIMPENVVGSYAVYHKTKGRWDITGAEKQYKVGKFGHIYRPHIIDSAGNETWAELHIDIEQGALTETIPEDFWNNAIYPIMIGTPGTATGYFHDYDAGEVFETNPNYMTDNVLTNYAITNNDKDIQKLTAHTTPPQDNISKVEIRVYGYGDGNDKIYLRPIFSGGDGDNHQWIPGTSSDWSSWFDITSDTNAPADWDSFFTSLDVDIEYDSVGGKGNMYISKVEVRETYDNDIFGYNTQGGVATIIAQNSQYCQTLGNTFNLSQAGTLDSLHANFVTQSEPAETLDVWVALYREDSGGSGSHGLVVSREKLDETITSTKTWKTFTAASEELTADDYVFAALGNGEDVVDSGERIMLSYDSITTRNRYNEATTAAGCYATRKAEDPWTEDATSGARDYSIYATYTPSGGAAPAEDPPIIIIID